jgi:hypothetical protein
MEGARALLAFRDGEKSDRAMVGAMMWAEYQSFMLSWGKAWERAHKK